jgi:AcrR family transcriptional regulator
MTKNEIIKAAFKAWGREMYLNTSLTQVARELRVSKPALYRHFKNKQALMDAMYEYFFDDYAAFIRADYEKAAVLADKTERMSLLLRTVVEYYARNADSFFFSLIHVYGDRKPGNMEQLLVSRGIDMRGIHAVGEECKGYPQVIQMALATIIFSMAYFHKLGDSFDKTPSEGAVQKLIGVVDVIISRGLSFNSERVDVLDYEGLERRISGAMGTVEENPLLKAVAQAVAEAGPWDASMDMVARRSGLSKSSLYGHFKSKKDMLRQLFMGEFKRIIAFAREGIKQSALPEEQFYLGVFSIAAYLRTRSEILIAIDWLRTRRPNMGKPAKPIIFRIFEDIDFAAVSRQENEAIALIVSGDRFLLTPWVLFLIVHILIHRPGGGGMDYADLPNSRIRDLYRFLTLGLKGFYII